MKHLTIMSALRQALMEAVCGLSYAGDIRMRWGEDAQKVQRIVEGSWSPLAQMLLPPMQVWQPPAHHCSHPHLLDACHLKTQLTLEDSWTGRSCFKPRQQGSLEQRFAGQLHALRHGPGHSIAFMRPDGQLVPPGPPWGPGKCQWRKTCAANTGHPCAVTREPLQLACRHSSALACTALQGDVGQAAGLRPGNGGSAFCDLRQASELEQSMTPQHTKRLLSFLPGVFQLPSCCLAPKVHSSPLHS